MLFPCPSFFISFYLHSSFPENTCGGCIKDVDFPEGMYRQLVVHDYMKSMTLGTVSGKEKYPRWCVFWL
jgi:hypothetical protein